jgi:hypothetical protein
MSKNIVICCDGTGNEFGDRNSNVVQLYSTLIVDGRRQIAYYHPGVGTMGAPTATNHLSKLWSVLTGLAFGAGLLDNIADAYRYLMEMLPPFGVLYGLPVYVDELLARDKEVVFNAGTHRDAVRMAYEDFVRLAKPKICAFV